jgi:predicted ABC-class ATPase
MWNIDFLEDPLDKYHHHHHRHHHHHDTGNVQNNNGRSYSTSSSFLLTASIPLKDFLGMVYYQDVQEGGHAAQVAIADFCGRHLVRTYSSATVTTDDTHTIQLETLDQTLLIKRQPRRRRQRRRNGGNNGYSFPYVIERSDVYCCSHSHNSSNNNVDKLHLMLRMNCQHPIANSIDKVRDYYLIPCQTILCKIFDVKNPTFLSQLLHHVATVVLQQRIRTQLTTLEAVAFLANGSILPRKSGTSSAPMASPPAIPFQAPVDSPMSQSISVEMGALAKYLANNNHNKHNNYQMAIPISLQNDNNNNNNNNTLVTLPGLIVPGGITLICGGGYHGKSTTLQAIAMGVYDKIPGDGREFCVSVASAVTVRAEDGRYVHNCNISAFISNLPTPPGMDQPLNTQHFSTRDASGSTSQAANVVEAIEMGATAILVDEDISAANFMARDGRMRALVMDESITPLLYRVNGLYHTHKISSVVVVGGVGDWLDVPHQVLLLDKYIAKDATKKAQSISYQFSYGHVQYAGRGVVHRLEWDKSGTPIARRPINASAKRYDSNVFIAILDGGHALSLHKDDFDDDNDDQDDSDHINTMPIIDDDDDGCVDASRIQQFLSKQQLYGAGICLVWLLQQAPKFPHCGLKGLLQQMDAVLDGGGMNQIVNDLQETTTTHGSTTISKTWTNILDSVGYLERPRSFEVGQILTRLHGIQMEEIPVEDDGSEDATRQEEERKKKTLADLWANRRST